MSTRSPSYMKYKPRYGRFCKRRFVGSYQKMNEKKLKNWNCIENGVIIKFGIIRICYHPDPQYTASAFQPIFLQSFCKIQFRLSMLNFSDFREWPTLHFRRTGLSGHSSRLETTRNCMGKDLGCMLNEPSLQCRAALATFKYENLRKCWWNIIKFHV